MDRKNLGKKVFKNISSLLAGLAILQSVACAPLSDKYLKEPQEPVKVESINTGNGYFKVFNKDKGETDVYLEEGLYKRLSDGKNKGELIEIEGISGLEGLCIEAGQGRWDAIKNNLSNGGGYFLTYSSQKKEIGEVYASEGTIIDACYKNTGEQIYDGRFEKVPGTNVMVKCVKFDSPISPYLDGGGDGSSGGSDGGGASGGGGSSGGDSGGSR